MVPSSSLHTCGRPWVVAAFLALVSLIGLPTAWALGSHRHRPTPTVTPIDAMSIELGPIAFDVPSGWLIARPQDQTRISLIVLAPSPMKDSDTYLSLLFFHEPATYEPFGSLDAWIEQNQYVLFRDYRNPFTSERGLSGFRVPDEMPGELYFLEVPCRKFVRIDRRFIPLIDSQIDALLLNARYTEALRC